MQTFLPYPDFYKSASVLDYRRLGKQRVEAFQILNTITGKSNGWKNHPAVKMWIGYEDALRMYMRSMITEWCALGYENNMAIPDRIENYNKPSWLGNDQLHSSHRGALKFKSPGWYNQFNWKEEPVIDYYWPV